MSTRFRPIPRLMVVAVGLPIMLSTWMAHGAEPESKPDLKSASIEALREFNGLIGNWRGIGQVKRGSPQGAWQEKAELVWELKSKSTGIRFVFDDGKEWKSALLTYDAENKQFQLAVTLPDDTSRTYQGKLQDKRLVLEGPGAQKEVHRLTLTLLNENRILVLFEKRPEQQSFFTRTGEIGYQRQGTKLAAVGGSGPVCVVTGGAGTIPVMHKGKTYYVCCTGCRDAFNDDPEAILETYQKQKSAPK